MKIIGNLVKTSIGELVFHVTAASGELSHATISLTEIDRPLPKTMSVENNIAALLTVTSPTDIINLQFSCAWQDCQLKGYACSGEGLDAWEWEDENQHIVIGTEDGEALSERLNLGEITRSNYPVSQRENRIIIEIEKFPANQELTLHFILASNSLPEENDCSCWFAVDALHEKIVKAFQI